MCGGGGSQLLGPKLPEVQRQTTGRGVRTFTDRYTPLGGLARLTGRAEVQMPLPGFGEQWQSFAFVDGGPAGYLGGGARRCNRRGRLECIFTGH